MRVTTVRDGRLVLPDRVIDGDLAIADGRILELAPRLPAGDHDLDATGRLVLPGLVDLHGDALEKEAEPRPGVFLPAAFAVAQADRRCALAGVTTVCHAVAFAAGELGLREPERARGLVEAILAADPARLVRHRVHLRYEITDPISAPVVDELLDRRPAVLSFMDHTPGQGQFRDLATYAAYLERTYGTAPGEAARRAEAKLAAAEAAFGRVEELASRARDAGVLLASHDDDAPERIRALAALGVQASEFPVHLEAARSAKKAGLAVIVGAPNLFRGASQSRGLSAREAIGSGLVDCLCSDYAPQTFLPAILAAARDGLLPLPEAVALASSRPAALIGRPDLGRLEPSATADLLLLDPAWQGTRIELVLVEGRPVLAQAPWLAAPHGLDEPVRPALSPVGDGRSGTGPQG